MNLHLDIAILMILNSQNARGNKCTFKIICHCLITC